MAGSGRLFRAYYESADNRGPNAGHLAASMIHQLAQQMRRGPRPRIFTEGEQKRDFVYVKDMVRLTLVSATRERVRANGQAGIYNAGSDSPRSFNDIVIKLNRVLGTELELEYIDNLSPILSAPHRSRRQHRPSSCPTIRPLRLSRRRC